MRRNPSFCTSTVALLAAVALYSGLGQGQQPALEKTSEQGLFLVSLESQLNPVPINRMHSWHVTVRNANEQAVLGAQITVTGGMPLHDHGLPTAPRMTRRLEEGRYLVEGMKFHMNGMWQLTLTIESGELSDTVTFDFDV